MKILAASDIHNDTKLANKLAEKAESGEPTFNINLTGNF